MNEKDRINLLFDTDYKVPKDAWIEVKQLIEMCPEAAKYKSVQKSAFEKQFARRPLHHAAKKGKIQ